MERTLTWKRLDYPGWEALRIVETGDGPTAVSDIVDKGERPYEARLEWRLGPDWQSRSLAIHLRNGAERRMLIERAGETAWRVDGADRPDLDGCLEIDVSATPFCNSLALRRLGGGPPGGAGGLTALYVPLPELALQPSRQRYERLDALVFRYIDEGAAAGFTARLDLDPAGFVRRYEGLFERA